MRMPPRSGRHGRDVSAGFTLVELIVVLAVISLVLALTMPSFRRSPASHAVGAVAQDVAASLRFTRNRAIVEDRPTRFVAGDGAFGAAGDQTRRHLPAGISLTLLDGAQSATGRPIRFYPDGSSSGGAISLTAGNMHYLVLVNWINGDVSIRPPAAQPSH